MLTVVFLILFPVLAALVLLVVRGEGARKVVSIGSALVIGAGSIVLAVQYLGQGAAFFYISSSYVDMACFAVDVVLMLAVISYGVKYRKWAAVGLAVVAIAMAAYFEFAVAHHAHVAQGLYIDDLSILMALIIGIVGSCICVYALGYMHDFQHHQPEGADDRRPAFFALMFLFLGAMFLIVFANNMAWMFTGWEITTVCSFLLIGYTRTEEAIENSFRQIIMNMLGGLGFCAALIYSGTYLGTLALDEFLSMGSVAGAAVAIPVTCLAFAGITKAAQMPFHTWLLGAMVAPTPTSALLHSSTMVKAGVFLLVKLAPVFAVCAVPAAMVMLVGCLTFLLCSLMAISQSNAKRVLAYSTIANLGLITACAGVGTPEAVWAAAFLILFHAIAKSLLFLCVGTAEHHIGSRDIEDMDLLFDRMPRLARYMMLGIMCMFIAPFGMLVAKWATLVSFAEADLVLLLVILAFGSAATFMFWAKWMGKLAGIAGQPENVEATVHKSEWSAMGLMALLIVACCMLMSVISACVVEPYIATVFGTFDEAISDWNVLISAILSVIVVAILFAGLGRGKAKKAGIYLAGASVDNEGRVFLGAMNKPQPATSRNWYMDSWFGEARLTKPGKVLCALVIVVALAAALMFPVGF